MTDAELAEARELCAAATPGPLEVIPSHNPNADDCACPVFDVVAPAGEIEQVPCAELCVEEDARLYATAPTLIPRLVAEIDRLRVEVLERRDNVDRLNLANMRLHEDVARLRDALEIVGPPEPPAEAFAAPDGPPVPCEVCCAPIQPGSPVASWVDGERQVVAHAGRCPGTIAPQIIDVATINGSLSLWAHVCGMWAAHEALGNFCDPNGWVVTHVPTGRAARFREGTTLSKAVALLLAEELGARCSSEMFRDPTSDAARKQIAAIVVRAVRP